MGSLGPTATMKTFLIFSACLLTIIIAQRPIRGERDRVFKVQNCLGDKIKVKLSMLANSCADRIPAVGFSGMPRGGFFTYGDPQPSCIVQRISAAFIKNQKLRCTVETVGLPCNGREGISVAVEYDPKFVDRSVCRIVCADSTKSC